MFSCEKKKNYMQLVETFVDVFEVSFAHQASIYLIKNTGGKK